MAVLLEDILERLNKVERQLNISTNHTVLKEKSSLDRSIQAKGNYGLLNSYCPGPSC